MKCLFVLMVSRWSSGIIQLVCTEGEQMEEYDNTACVY